MEVSHSLPGQTEARVKSHTIKATPKGVPQLHVTLPPTDEGWVYPTDTSQISLAPEKQPSVTSLPPLALLRFFFQVCSWSSCFIMFSPLSFQEASLPLRVLKCSSVLGAGCFPMLHVNVFTLSMFDVPPMFETCCLASEINRRGRVIVSCGSLYGLLGNTGN